MRGHEVPPIHKFRGADYSHDTGEPLPENDLKQAQYESEVAVERHFAGIDLHQELRTYLGERSSRVEEHRDSDEISVQIAVTTSTPKKIEGTFPNRLWLRGDFFEHDNCYVGVSNEIGSFPVVANFVADKEEKLDIDLLGSTRQLTALMREINRNCEDELPI